jgi:hypothetical protein
VTLFDRLRAYLDRHAADDARHESEESWARDGAQLDDAGYIPPDSEDEGR